MSNSLAITLKSSVVKKQLVGITGLLLCGFLVSHLLGNFLLFVGPEAFNKYGHALTSNPLIYVAEAGLLALFLGHMGLALKATLENKAARPQKYYMKTKTGRGSTLASSTMPYTGAILLVFIIFHLQGLKFGAVYNVTYDGVVMRDLYRLTFEKFSNLPYVAFYVFSMFAMGIHVSHGFWSAFQSVGFWHNRYTNTLRKTAVGYALFVGIGFSILPIYCFLTGVN
jgi:succinate dehydrogenase / fumarate reductase cytochrome b subunit